MVEFSLLRYLRIALNTGIKGRGKLMTVLTAMSTFTAERTPDEEKFSVRISPVASPKAKAPRNVNTAFNAMFVVNTPAVFFCSSLMGGGSIVEIGRTQ